MSIKRVQNNFNIYFNIWGVCDWPEIKSRKWYRVVESCACLLCLLRYPLHYFLVIQVTLLYVHTSGWIQTRIDGFTVMLLLNVTGEIAGGHQLLGGGFSELVRTPVRQVFPRANVSIWRYAYSLWRVMACPCILHAFKPCMFHKVVRMRRI